jgi:hypothetical protein
MTRSMEDHFPSQEQILEECAKAIWSKFARISDPSYGDRRWARMNPIARQSFIDEAKACIATYEALTR